MKSVFTAALLSTFALSASSASAHSAFKKELQTQFNLKSVSCYACHSRESDVPADQLEAYEENKKSFRNDFGQQFDKLMKDKNLSAKIRAAKDADDDPAEEEAEAEALEAFKEALKTVVQTNAPSGKSYAEEIESGTMDGIKIE